MLGEVQNFFISLQLLHSVMDSTGVWQFFEENLASVSLLYTYDIVSKVKMIIN